MTGVIDTSRTVFLFPGVGAQQANMFAEFEEFPEYRERLVEASDISGVDLLDVVHGGSSERLTDVRTAQLALTATTVAVAAILRDRCGLIPDFVMGHSLGQFSALCAAGHLGFGDTVHIVDARAQVVRDCAARFEAGEMCWVLRIPAGEAESMVAAARERDGIDVHVSAIDAYDQVSISGEMAEIRRLAPRIEAAGGLIYPLRIGGPFHSPLMSPARAMLAERLGSLPVANDRALVSRLVCNVSGEELTSRELETSIFDHLISPVRWLQGLQFVARQGVTRYLEISPKTVLQYLNARAGTTMRAVCEPTELASLVAGNDTRIGRSRRLAASVFALLYGEPVAAGVAADPDARRQADEIRTAFRERTAAQAIDALEPELLFQTAEQWLNIIGHGRGAQVERARLRHMLQAAVR